jgi:hypothetical protein
MFAPPVKAPKAKTAPSVVPTRAPKRPQYMPSRPGVGLSNQAMLRYLAADFTTIPIAAPSASEKLPTATRIFPSGIRAQGKLRIGAVDDPLEREADHAAEQVMRMPATGTSQGALQLSRKCDDCEANGGLQKKPGSAQPASGEAPASVGQVLHSPGRPLDPATRAYFEPRFGRDFSYVRVHAGPAAAQSAGEVDAHAYTVGQDIVFASGRLAPESTEGRRLIAHELAHVVQQSDGSTPERAGSDRGGTPPALTAAGPTVARDPVDPKPGRHNGLTRAERAKLQAAREYYNLSSSQSTLVGILILENGEELPLKSGEEGGPYGGTQRGDIPRGRGEGYSGGGHSQGNIATHVEGQAAAIMHQRNISSATLLIEEPPCAVCDHPTRNPNITVVLPPGAKLLIVDPDAAGTYWSSQPLSAGGAPTTPKPLPAPPGGGDGPGHDEEPGGGRKPAPAAPKLGTAGETGGGEGGGAELAGSSAPARRSFLSGFFSSIAGVGWGNHEGEMIFDFVVQKLYFEPKAKEFLKEKMKAAQPQIVARLKPFEGIVITQQMLDAVMYANVRFLLEYTRLHGTNTHQLSAVRLDNVEVSEWYRAGTSYFQPGISEAIGQHAMGYSALLGTYSEALELHPWVVQIAVLRLDGRIIELNNQIAGQPASNPAVAAVSRQRNLLQSCRTKLLGGGMKSLGGVRSECFDVIARSGRP